MRIARRVAAWIAGSLLGLAFVFFAVVVVTSRSGNPDLFPVPADEQGVDILLVNNGYHSGLVLPRAILASIAQEQEQGGLASLQWRAVWPAVCRSNWAGLMKPSAEWRRIGL